MGCYATGDGWQREVSGWAGEGLEIDRRVLEPAGRDVGGLSGCFSTGLRGAEGWRVWRAAFEHTASGRAGPLRWAWRKPRAAGAAGAQAFKLFGGATTAVDGEGQGNHFGPIEGDRECGEPVLSVMPSTALRTVRRLAPGKCLAKGFLVYLSIICHARNNYCGYLSC